MQDEGNNETILIIEDEEMMHELLKSFIEGEGYKVISAMDGLEGVEKFRQNKDEIALVVSDIGLPGISGWEAASQIREINPSVKVIITSGYMDSDASEKAAASGMTEIVHKPYRPHEILLKIRSMIDKV